MKPGAGTIPGMVCRGAVIVCLGAGALVQGAQPVDYYDSADTATASALRASLNDIVTAGSVRVGYGNTNAALSLTDEDPDNPSNVILIYSGDSRPKSGSSGEADLDPATGGWNREHAFPQSAFNGVEPMRSDLHALFPCDTDLNTRRSDHPYGIVDDPAHYSDFFGNRDSGGAQAIFMPRPEDRGRVARAILYMDIRYEGEGSEPDLTVVDTYPAGAGSGQMAYLSTLLDWHRQYPPTAFERARNARVYNRQKNANPFVDHPEWVPLIYGGAPWTVADGDTLTVTGVSRAAATITAGTYDVPMLTLELGLAANEFHIGQVSVTQTGTASDSGIDAVRLWWDVDGNGLATSADQLLDTRTFSGGAASFDLSAHPFYVAPGTTRLLVTVSVSPGAMTGDTVAVRVEPGSILPHAVGGADTAPVYAAIESAAMTVTGGLHHGDALSSVTAASRAPLSAISGAADLPLLSLSMTLEKNEWDLRQMTLKILGSAADSDLSQFNLYHDANANGMADGSDLILASGKPAPGGLATTIVLDTPFRITAGTATFLITASISPTAVQDRTLGVQVMANSIIHSSTGGFDANPATPNLDSSLVTILVPQGSPNGLFISEVFEGTSGNLKYVELYNGSDSPINLSSPQIRLRRYSNGSLTIGATINLTGVVPPGGYYVIANNATDMTAVFGPGSYNATSTAIAHSGNDVYDLYQAGAPGILLDSFAADLAGTADDFAKDVVAFRIFDQLPNSGAWGGSVQPVPNGNSPSGFWATRQITSGNGNAAEVGTPGYGHGAGGAEVPVNLSGFGLE